MLGLSNEMLSAIYALIVAVVIRAVYQAYRDPIASVPGPWLARWTTVILQYHWIIGDRPKYVHRLHEEYGPIVRISPDEIDICDVDVVRDMAKTSSGFLKSAWYDTMAVGGYKNIFSVRDPKAHSIRRRLLSAPMTDTSLQSIEPTIDAKSQLAVSQMQKELKARGAMDVFQWWYFMSTDLVGELTFGESFQLLERGEKNQFAMDLERLPKLGMIGTAFPMVIKLARRLPIPYFRDALQAGQRISAYAEKALLSYEALTSQDPSNARPTLFTKLFHNAESADINIISEARGYIVGGSDNTAISLTYLVWAVSQHEEIRKVLLHELDSLPGTFGDHELKELPFLNQVVNETLRLYATNPSNRPRNPPAPGANLGGYWIPNDITVSTQAYSLHRDTNIFPDPEKFDPWRWASPTPEMNRAFVPFGGGSRTIRELRLGAAHFFRAFPQAKMSSLEKMDDSDMDQMCYFIMSPKRKRCLMEAP